MPFLVQPSTALVVSANMQDDLQSNSTEDMKKPSWNYVVHEEQPGTVLQGAPRVSERLLSALPSLQVQLILNHLNWVDHGGRVM